MKRLFLLLFLCFSLSISTANAQHFGFFIETTTANESFTIPVDGSLTYNYNADVINPFVPSATVSYTNQTGELTHTFGNPGIYLIRILDGSVFPRINFSNSPDKLKITFITNWGNNPWVTMESAFEGCSNLKLDASDTPNLSNLTSTQKMFFGATSLEDVENTIGSWDMSTVERMGFMFRDCTVFNEDISNWDTSSAETFTRMFQNAPAFDQNLGNWDVSNLTSNGTDAMFAQAGVSTSNYDQTVIGWGTLDPGETQIPTDLNIRFDNSTYCTSEAARTILSNTPFNWTFTDSGLDCSTVSDEAFFITTWETTTANESITIPSTGNGYYIDWGDGATENSVSGNATHTYTNAGTYTVKIGGLFTRINFNNSGDKLKIKSIEQWGDIIWQEMANAFNGCENLVLNATDAPNLTNIITFFSTFRGCFNIGSPNLNNWDVSNITEMTQMFFVSNFDGDISNWDVGNVQFFSSMFEQTPFNQDISNWNIGEHVSVVSSMRDMFRQNNTFNKPLNNWDVSKVENMRDMFRDATGFNQSLANWDITSVTNLSGMLNNSGLSIENYDATLTGWATLENGETQIPTNLNLGASGLQYCEAIFSRDLLDTTYSWTITDAGVNCDDSAFITTWETTSANESITIPTEGTGYNYYIDWGDGTVAFNQTGNATHTYTTAGTHTVKIAGDFPSIYFNNAVDKNKILSVEQWGTNQWTSMARAFFGCANLVLNATDTPDLSNVTNMNYMFTNTSSLVDNGGRIDDWDTGTIEIMGYVFQNSNFNQSINNWDVSNAHFLGFVFRNNTNYNQPLNNWELAVDVNLIQVFAGATAFNQDLSDWDISGVNNLEGIFNDSGMSIENYDSTLIGWATLDVDETQIPTDLTLGATGVQFCQASLAKRDLLFFNDWTITDDGIGCPEEDKFITVWKTTSANENIRLQVNGSRFFTVEWGDGTTSIDQVSNAEHTYAQAGTYEVKISGYIGGLRYNNLPPGTSTRLKLYEIKQWGAQQWERMADSYYGCDNVIVTATDVPDLSQITDISDMFRNCNSLEDIGGKMGTWDVSTVENFNTMFENTTSFSRSLGDWDLSSATNMTNMLNNSGLSSNSYDLTLTGWRNNPNTPSNINLGASGLTYCNAVSEHDYLDTDLNWNLNDAGINCPTDEPFITKWETTTANETITIPTHFSANPANNYNYSYYVDWGDGTAITFETGGATENAEATHEYATAGIYDVKITGEFPSLDFEGAASRDKILSVEQWGVIEWNSMAKAFRGCTNLVVNATDIPDLSEVTSMLFMFAETGNFADNGGRIPDWDTRNITLMGYMFQNSTFNENINNWNVSNVEFMGFMFKDNSYFNQPLNNWKLSNDVSLHRTFANATAFNQDLGDWDISGVNNMENMLKNTSMSIENYDTTLIGWATLDASETQIPSNINLGAQELQYCASQVERDLLESTYNWTITDAGLSCDLQLATKVYLQGAYTNPNTGEELLMRDDLRIAGLIPTLSPYADGAMCDATVFDVTGDDAIVDWVLIELRDPTDNTTILASTSALLQRDGDVVDIDGTSAVAIGVASGDYYVAVKHRNHLGVLSSNTITLSTSTAVVNLSSNTTTVTGGALALRDMGNGIYAMYAGDATGDGNILNTDISNAIGTSGGINIYSGADANMDGNILNTDIALIIQPNAGRIQQF
ncbi:BspA family leucine-rich repeat surface protein [Dokdonia sp.]|uniref:BspA family leucine-rich repeat surface protein n=1 Tax=Dokdonia sp. TaxID=2024995 RepID=UPI003265882F